MQASDYEPGDRVVIDLTSANNHHMKPRDAEVMSVDADAGTVTLDVDGSDVLIVDTFTEQAHPKGDPTNPLRQYGVRDMRPTVATDGGEDDEWPSSEPMELEAMFEHYDDVVEGATVEFAYENKARGGITVREGEVVSTRTSHGSDAVYAFVVDVDGTAYSFEESTHVSTIDDYNLSKTNQFGRKSTPTVTRTRGTITDMRVTPPEAEADGGVEIGSVDPEDYDPHVAANALAQCEHGDRVRLLGHDRDASVITVVEGTWRGHHKSRKPNKYARVTEHTFVVNAEAGVAKVKFTESFEPQTRDYPGDHSFSMPVLHPPNDGDTTTLFLVEELGDGD